MGERYELLGASSFGGGFVCTVDAWAMLRLVALIGSENPEVDELLELAAQSCEWCADDDELRRQALLEEADPEDYLGSLGTDDLRLEVLYRIARRMRGEIDESYGMYVGKGGAQ